MSRWVNLLRGDSKNVALPLVVPRDNVPVEARLFRLLDLHSRPTSDAHDGHRELGKLSIDDETSIMLDRGAAEAGSPARSPRRRGPFRPIVRQQVLARLEEACDERIGLLVASAGFGKSIALAAFIDSDPDRFVRYDVARNDTTLAAFVRGLAHALARREPTILETLPDVLNSMGGERADIEALVRWFTSAISNLEFTLVIDDLHIAATDELSISFIIALIDGLPDTINFLISTRPLAGLPVSQWLAYNKCGIPVDEHDLQISQTEGRDIAAHLGLRVTDEEINALLEVTAGWPTAFIFALPECVKLFETSFAKECYAAMGSGGLMKTVGARAGGSGVPFTKRDGLRAYAA